MSDYNRESGRLIPRSKRGEVDKAVKNILDIKYAEEYPIYHKNYPTDSELEALKELSYAEYDYERYIVIDDILWENVEHSLSHEVEFCNIRADQNDIVYDTTYWNGGTYLGEVLENAVNGYFKTQGNHE